MMNDAIEVGLGLPTVIGTTFSVEEGLEEDDILASWAPTSVGVGMTASGCRGTRDRNSGIVGAALLPLASTGRHADRAELGVGARQTVVDWRQAAGFAKGSDCRVELVHHNQPGGVVDRCPVDRAHKTNQLRGLQVSQVFEHAEQLTSATPCGPASRLGVIFLRR